MKEIKLNETELFKNLVEVAQGEIYIDLHNDYKCTLFLFDKVDNVVKVSFQKINSTNTNKQVELVFNDVEIVRMSLSLQLEFECTLTMDNFYRGRFGKNGILHEYSPDGKSYYYIEFDEEYNAELFASDVSAFIT